jgi:hypothetical protein
MIGTSLIDKNILSIFCMQTNCLVVKYSDEDFMYSNKNIFI